MWISFAVAATLLAGESRIAVGQNTPVIFQHGINSDATTWQPVSDALAAVFALTPIRVTTGSRRIFQDQEQVLLAGTTALPDSTIGVGHSNGGILLREANADGRKMRGIVTIGSGHTGAGIARSLASGLFGDWGRYFVGTTALPVNVYQQFYDNNDYWYAGSQAARYWNSFGQTFATFGDLYGLAYQPLLAEMTPGSAFLGNLNSGANLSREASSLAARIGIVSSLSSTNGVIFRSLWDQATTNSLVQFRDVDASALYGAYFYYAFYDNTLDPNYYAKTYYAYLWSDAGDAVTNMDVHWCYNTEAYTGQYPYILCAPSDAIVPSARQSYPSYTRQMAVQDVSHNEETSSLKTQNALKDIFNAGALKIALRGAPPPTTPLQITLSGPTTVVYGDWASWQVIATGGTPPYRYSWSGLATGEEASVGFSVYQGGYLYVWVYDSKGAHSDDVIQVTVDYTP
jgi:pimeloyl-ACP methyl ester carboxylesterase